jgi:hypothetical protein
MPHSSINNSTNKVVGGHKMKRKELEAFLLFTINRVTYLFYPHFSCAKVFAEGDSVGKKLKKLDMWIDIFTRRFYGDEMWAYSSSADKYETEDRQRDFKDKYKDMAFADCTHCVHLLREEQKVWLRENLNS